MDTPLEKQKILIVDDTPANVKLLVNALLPRYELIVANEGESALRLAREENPDLVLLDIMMPGMDGYAVCRNLKEREETRAIPVIFLTAMSSATDEMTGFQIGAVDYITKPFSVAIVLSRVATHLALRSAYVQLERQYAALCETELLRKDVESIVRHDMKSPIDGIIGCSTLLLRNEALPRTELRKFIQMIQDSARRLREMVNLSLNLVKMEQGRYQSTLQSVDFLPILHRVLADQQTMIEANNTPTFILINDQPEQGGESFSVMCDETLCYTMMANLIRNALEASAEGQLVRIFLQDRGAEVGVAVHNHGAVPEEIRSRFFDKYVTCGKKGGTGLGTYSARLMAEAQKGRIELQSSEREGTTVTVILAKGEELEGLFDRR
ncbi:MAG: hybrid sensor histidine kinase/response regulator [Magnetococcales bacterium]|nr:hybrid sensor histidine kinase/response regulator [Magnetococcales bacterium]